MGAVEELPANPTNEQQMEALRADGLIPKADGSGGPGAGEGAEGGEGAGGEGGDGSGEEATGQQGAEGGEGERPAWLPDKFKSAEDMAKSYAELERKQGGKHEAKTGGKPLEAKPKGGKEGEGAATLTPEYLGQLGVEWQENDGKLTDESYATLEGFGLTREVINQIAQSQQVSSAVGYAQALEAAGIEDWDATRTWIEENKSPEQVAAFNEMYTSPNHDARVMALKSMQADFAAAQGQGPAGSGSEKIVEGSNAAGGSLQPFASMEEQVRAMSVTDANGHVRYDIDPVYRESVDKRIKV